MIAAREACHRLGLPHVTLDLREEFRRAIVGAVHPRLRAGRDAEPVHRVQRELPLRGAARVRRARGRARLATGHYARIVRHRGRLLLARAADPPRIRATCSRGVDPRFLDRLWFPLGTQTKAETRAEAERAGLAAARRPESQEACFLAGDDYRDFLGRHGLATERGAIVDESGRELGSHDGFWRFTPGQRRGLGVAAAEPLYALRTDARDEHGHGRAARVARQRRRSVRAGASTSTSSACTRSCAIAPSRSRQPSTPTTPASVSTSTNPCYGVARGQAAVLYEDDVVVGAGLDLANKIAAMLAYSSGEVVDVALAIFLILVGAGIAWVCLELGATLQRLSAFIKGTQDEVLPVINKVGTTVDHVNAQMEKVDQITDSAVDAADSADTAVRAVSFAITRPVQKITGFAAGVSHGVAEFKTRRNWRGAVDVAKAAATEREQELAEELREADRA